MGKASIVKGTAGEVEVVNLCKAHGLVDARRTGMWKAHDILVTIGRKIWNVEVKRRKRCLEWIYKELEAGRDAVFVRADHQYWLTITRSKDFFVLAAGASGSAEISVPQKTGESGNETAQGGATPSTLLHPAFHEPLDEEAA